MAFTNQGSAGTGTGSTSGSSHTLTTTAAFASGDFALLRITTDNIATADGATSTHTGVSGWTGTATKLGERTNTVGGAAADGATVSLWLLQATGTMAIGTVLTMNFSAPTVDKCSMLQKFNKAAGTSVRLATGSTVQDGGTDASTNPGSLAISGLSSAARLYYRAIGAEANSATTVTPTTNFTGVTTVRSRNNASAVSTYAEFRINTSTGETSAPTLPTAGDNASLFVALEEYTPPTVTWSTTDKSSTWALSEDNLRASATAGGIIGVRGNTAHATGKWYFEFKQNSGTGFVGFANATQALTDAWSTANTAGWYQPTGTIGGWTNNGWSSFGGGTALPVGSWGAIAIDLSAGLIWFRSASGWWNGDPATGTGGYSISGLSGQSLYPYLTLNNAEALDLTANFGFTSFAYTAPTGFSAWSVAEPAVLAAGTGAYTLTASAAMLRHGFALAAGSGTFTGSGNAASFTVARKLVAATGAAALTGRAAVLKAARTLTAAAGAFTAAGAAATLRRGYALAAATAAFTVTRNSAGLVAARKLTAAGGSMTVAGGAGALTAGRKLVAAQAAMSFAGQAAALKVARTLTAGTGAQAVTGRAAALTAARKLAAATSAVAVAGGAAALLRGYRLNGGSSFYAGTGSSAGLFRGFTLSAGAGSFVLTGRASSLTYTPGTTGYTLAAQGAAFALGGRAVALSCSRRLSAGAASMSLAGLPAALPRGLRLTAQGAVYTVTLRDFSASTPRILRAGSATFGLAGQDLRGLARFTALHSAPAATARPIEAQVPRTPAMMMQRPTDAGASRPGQFSRGTR